MGDVPAAAALTLGIIQLGRALHLSTIAEGIEDAGQLSELTDGELRARARATTSPSR